MNQQRLTDQDIRAAFERRADGVADPELGERIRSATRASRQKGHLRYLPATPTGVDRRFTVLAAAALTTVALGGALLAGGAFDRTAEPSVPAPSVPPPSQGPSGEPVEAAFAIDDVVHFGFSEFEARQQPGGEIVDAADPVVPQAYPMLVVAGPAYVEDVEWYLVTPASGDPEIPTGWVAATTAGGITDLLDPASIACPEPGFDLAATELRDGLLHCFGGHATNFTAEISCSIEDPSLRIAGPTWLEDARGVCRAGSPAGIELFGAAMDGFFSVMEGTSDTFGEHRIFGHFADPDARLCEWADPGHGVDDALADHECRTAFIVDATTAVEEPKGTNDPTPAGTEPPIPSIDPSIDPTFRVHDFVTVTGGAAVHVSDVPGGEPIPYYEGSSFSLPAGVPLIVVHGPVVVDGTEWYYFAFAARVIDTISGWAPIDDVEGNRQIVPTTVGCPTQPISAGEATLTLGWPGCFGSDEVTIVGSVGCGSPSDSDIGFGDGAWCRVELAPQSVAFIARIPQDLADGSYVLVGHFADPGAESCRWNEDPNSRILHDLGAIASCRAHFVVTNWESDG